MQLREAVLTARARLKQSELEAEQWKEELRRLQAHSQEQGQQIHALRQERQAGQERTNRCVRIQIPSVLISLTLDLSLLRNQSASVRFQAPARGVAAAAAAV